jgi:hypothetical protein
LGENLSDSGIRSDDWAKQWTYFDMAERDMGETAVPGKPQKPHGLDWRPVVNDYRVKAGRSGTAEISGPAEVENPDPALADPKPALEEGEDAMVSPINLRKFQEQLNRSRLDEISALVLSLTYGEMIEMASAIWKAQPEGTSITQDNLPGLLHRWSKSRSAGADGDPQGTHSE